MKNTTYVCREAALKSVTLKKEASQLENPWCRGASLLAGEKTEVKGEGLQVGAQKVAQGGRGGEVGGRRGQFRLQCAQLLSRCSRQPWVVKLSGEEVHQPLCPGPALHTWAGLS